MKNKVCLEAFLKNNGFKLKGWMEAFKAEETINMKHKGKKLHRKAFKYLKLYGVLLEDIFYWAVDDDDLIDIFIKDSGYNRKDLPEDFYPKIEKLNKKWIRYIARCGYSPKDKISKHNFSFKYKGVILRPAGIRKKILFENDIYTKFKKAKKKGRL